MNDCFIRKGRLSELPVRALKIDVSFVKRLTESTTNALIVQATTVLGKALNLEVIAEGVETEQQLINRTRLTRLAAEVLQAV